ncbi:MAG: hypothetical protein WAV38_39620 [Xanthobacteraceae bacterium]
MSDHDDTENLSIDHIQAALALVDLAGELHDLAINNKTYKARLRRQAALEKKNAAAEAKLAAAEAAAAEIRAKAESDAKAIRDEAQQRLGAAESAEAELAQREQKNARLEAAWRYIGEPQDVLSGLRSPEFSPLQKARMAHGQPAGKDPDRLFSEPDAAPAMPIDALSDTSDDPAADRQGAPFLGGLSRDVSHHKRRGAA